MAEEPPYSRYPGTWFVPPTSSATFFRLPLAYLLSPSPTLFSSETGTHPIGDNDGAASVMDLKSQSLTLNQRFSWEGLPTVQEDISGDGVETSNALPTSTGATLFPLPADHHNNNGHSRYPSASELWVNEDDWHVAEQDVVLAPNALGLYIDQSLVHQSSSVSTPDITAPDCTEMTEEDLGDAMLPYDMAPTAGPTTFHPVVPHERSQRDSALTMVSDRSPFSVEFQGDDSEDDDLTIVGDEKDDTTAGSSPGATQDGRPLDKLANKGELTAAASRTEPPIPLPVLVVASNRDSKRVKKTYHYSVPSFSATSLVTVASRKLRSRTWHDLVLGLAGLRQPAPSPSPSEKTHGGVPRWSWMDAERAVHPPLPPPRITGCLSALSWAVRRWWQTRGAWSIADGQGQPTWLGPTRPAAIVVDITVERQRR